jgi:hypothetical protein
MRAVGICTSGKIASSNEIDEIIVENKRSKTMSSSLVFNENFRPQNFYFWSKNIEKYRISLQGVFGRIGSLKKSAKGLCVESIRQSRCF